MAQSYGGRGRRESPRSRIRVEDDGETRSLVVDETFASFYRPGEVATGCVWDAIAAPLLWLPPKRRRRILLLGLGGGSVARIARALAPEAELVGVEFEPEVVRLARRHLDLDETGVRVEVADARTWVEAECRARGRYDAILEDVFVGSGDDVHKPDWIPDPMHAQAFRMLAPGGVFVSNTLDEHARVAKSLRARFEGLVVIETEDYDNRVLAAGGAGLTGAALRDRVADSEVLAPSLDVLSFRTRRR
ncbi:MAG: fused MFS/spermidine synthase [Myxococcota bacterium]